MNKSAEEDCAVLFSLLKYHNSRKPPAIKIIGGILRNIRSCKTRWTIYLCLYLVSSSPLAKPGHFQLFFPDKTMFEQIKSFGFVQSKAWTLIWNLWKCGQKWDIWSPGLPPEPGHADGKVVALSFLFRSIHLAVLCCPSHKPSDTD